MSNAAKVANAAREKLVVVGAGVGGLCAAARLAHEGYDVEVYEKNRGPGGRCGLMEVDGYRFDMGPTLLLMPEVARETFAAVGRNLDDYLTLHRCDPNYRLTFSDGSHLQMSTNLADLRGEFEKIEKGSGEALLEFLRLGDRQYRVSLERFVGRNFDHLGQFLTPANLREVVAIKALASMYKEVAKLFDDARLRAALTFQTMYLGISPYEAPAVYGLLPFVEIALGIFFPKGGMFAIPLALEKLCKELGVRFHYNAEVERITTQRAGKRLITDGVRLKGGQVVRADAVLCNVDLPFAYKNLLGEEVKSERDFSKAKYTSSAFMFYWGIDQKIAGLEHHNAYLDSDYEGSFADIFANGRVPKSPSFYVNVPSKTDPTMAPAGKDSVYVLVPVPDSSFTVDWASEGQRIRKHVLDTLSAKMGVPDLGSHIVVERVFTPDDWQTAFSLERGAAFGLSHNFMQVGPFRPVNQDKRVRNLFFVGASTQPGTGIPMVMLSAKLVTERVLQHFSVAHAREPANARTQAASSAVAVAP